MRAAVVRATPLLLLSALAAIGPAPLAAQIPERFENLKVLPTDIPRDSLVQIMRGFSFSLGVRCGYCHEGTEGNFNFKSDAKPEKEKARFMMRMTRNLNTQVLAQLPDRRNVGVACVTCHRGLPVPTTLDRVLAAAIDSGGVQAAVARYRQLRTEAMPLGRYDFSETTLNELARRLGTQNKTAEAIALLELNQEFYPNSGTIDFQLGELHRMRGERDKAIARYRMAVEKQPNNQQAQRRLNELTGAAPAPAPPTAPPPRPRR